LQLPAPERPAAGGQGEERPAVVDFLFSAAQQPEPLFAERRGGSQSRTGGGQGVLRISGASSGGGRFVDGSGGVNASSGVDGNSGSITTGGGGAARAAPLRPDQPRLRQAWGQAAPGPAAPHVAHSAADTAPTAGLSAPEAPASASRGPPPEATPPSAAAAAPPATAQHPRADAPAAAVRRSAPPLGASAEEAVPPAALVPAGSVERGDAAVPAAAHQAGQTDPQPQAPLLHSSNARHRGRRRHLSRQELWQRHRLAWRAAEGAEEAPSPGRSGGGGEAQAGAALQDGGSGTGDQAAPPPHALGSDW
jgi:hypothetical protein